MESSFTIVAEPNRRAILTLLLTSERSVGELEHELGLSQPSVSKHLRVLKDAGLVESRVEAQKRLYRLRPGPLQELDEWILPFRRFWSKHLDALERHLDSMDEPSPKASTKGKKKHGSLLTRPRVRRARSQGSRQVDARARARSQAPAREGVDGDHRSRALEAVGAVRR